MKAVTDAGTDRAEQREARADCQSVHDDGNCLRRKRPIDFFNEKYNNCEIRYGDMKKQLAEDINKFCAPIRERILDMRRQYGTIWHKVARMGAEKARESASKTLNEVRQIIGFRPY